MILTPSYHRIRIWRRSLVGAAAIDIMHDAARRQRPGFGLRQKESPTSILSSVIVAKQSCYKSVQPGRALRTSRRTPQGDVAPEPQCGATARAVLMRFLNG